MKLKKIIFAVVLTVLTFASISISALAAIDGGVYTRVFDRDNNLSTSEEQRIYDAATGAESLTGVIFLVAVYDCDFGIPSGSSVVSSFGYSTSKDDVVLLIIEQDGGSYYYEMFTYGRAHTSISDSAADRVLDNRDVYSNIKSGNLADGAVAFINKTTEELQESAADASGFDLEEIAVRIAISLAAGIASVVVVIVIYKTKLKSPIYPLSQFADLKLAERSDIFIGKNVTRTKINTSSGSSGSGGSSGGSRGRR
jgi:uncharacterized membrane protein YgcG